MVCFFSRISASSPSLTIELIRRPERQFSFAVKLASEALLPELVDRLRLLKQSGVLHSIVHIGNQRRAVISFAPLIKREHDSEEKTVLNRREAEQIVTRLSGPWMAFGNINGSKGGGRPCHAPASSRT